jgi:hypothetical protein
METHFLVEKILITCSNRAFVEEFKKDQNFDLKSRPSSPSET